MNKKTNYGKAIFQAVATCLVAGLVLFGTAGSLSWLNGWLFTVAYFALVVSLTGFFTRSPELVKERWTAGKKAKTWDRWLVMLVAVVLPLAYLVLAGLDKRFGWTAPFPLYVVLLCLGVMVVSNSLSMWAMASNPFFSSHARIQADRGQKVVSTGPYAYVRHPGYTGAIFFNLAAPLVLGSFPALWAGVAIFLLLILRTVLEDKMLRDELPGYRSYAQKVRYKLIPFIW